MSGLGLITNFKKIFNNVKQFDNNNLTSIILLLVIGFFK